MRCRMLPSLQSREKRKGAKKEEEESYLVLLPSLEGWEKGRGV